MCVCVCVFVCVCVYIYTVNWSGGDSATAMFRLQNVSDFWFLLICFAREIQYFYQSSLGNKVDFRDIINVSSNILAKN